MKSYLFDGMLAAALFVCPIALRAPALGQQAPPAPPHAPPSSQPAAPPASQPAVSPATAPAITLAEATAYYHAGLDLQHHGHLQEAMAKYALATSPAVECVGALNHFAWLLAANPQPSYRDGKRALALALRATAGARASGDVLETTACMDTLAAAYAETGDFDDAIATARKSILAARMEGRHTWTKEFGQRLKFYEAHKPYHDPPAATQPTE